MKTIRFKIREQYIPLIRGGKKEHEYRVSKNKDIRVGDSLLLVSNQNTQNFVRVLVDSVEHVDSWEEALCGRWEKDFEGLFETLDEVINECSKYYSRDVIKEYGIDVIGIKPIKKQFKNARFLLDTNVVIEREGVSNVLEEVSLAYKWLDNVSGTKIIHPKTVDEIKKYKNEDVRNSILKKLNSYNILIPSPEKDSFFDEVCSEPKDDHTVIDNEILLQVYNGCVDYLITSDRGIINKAKKLYIGDSVLTPNDFLVSIEKENPKLIEYDVLSIQLCKIGSLNIHDEFFNSLREDYGGSDFNKWFTKKDSEDAYVFKSNQGLQGFLYLKTEGKDESYDHFYPKFLPAKRLKIGTFKISQSGLRLGERFLKIIFDNALLREVDEIYVTMFENKRKEVVALKKLMEQWGFEKKAINTKNGEIVLVKNMRNYNYDKNPKYNYPLQKTPRSITFLPIYSIYHTKLFPDLHLKSEDMHLYGELACKYAIEKIYVCGWKNIRCKPGDLVCVYRMGDYYATYTSVVTGFAVVQEIIYPSTKNQFIKECKNKSVFTEEELNDFFDSGKYRTIVKVLFLEGLSKKVNLDSLHKNGVLSETEGPRINTFISEQKLGIIKELGGLNN